jgi:hypothetical protein
VKNDAETFKPLGPPIRKEQPKPAPPVVKKQTNVPQPPLHINDMDMIKRDFGNTPPPWGIFHSYNSWETFYYPVVKMKHPSFRGGDE